MYTGCPCCCCPYIMCCRLQMNTAYRQHYWNTFENTAPMHRQKEFTIEELAQYDGSGGKPAYTAVNGIVYDVSYNPAWGGGTHFGLYAGKDLTSQFQGCHPASAILQKLPKMGILKQTGGST